jgi:hypothetical protein
MKQAGRVREFGPPEVLKIENVADLEPGGKGHKKYCLQEHSVGLG